MISQCVALYSGVCMISQKCIKLKEFGHSWEKGVPRVTLDPPMFYYMVETTYQPTNFTVARVRNIERFGTYSYDVIGSKKKR